MRRTVTIKANLAKISTFGPRKLSKGTAVIFKLCGFIKGIAQIHLQILHGMQKSNGKQCSKVYIAAYI